MYASFQCIIGSPLECVTNIDNYFIGFWWHREERIRMFSVFDFKSTDAIL